MWRKEFFCWLGKETGLLSVALVFVSKTEKCGFGNHIFCIDFLHFVSSRYDHFAVFPQFERFAGFVDHSADSVAMYSGSDYFRGYSSFRRTEIDYFTNLD